MEINKYKLNRLKKNLLNNYRTSLNSLVHIGFLTHKQAEDFIFKVDTIIYLKKKRINHTLKEKKIK